MIFFYFNVKDAKHFALLLNEVLSIVINIQNTTIFEPVILTGFYTSSYINKIFDLFILNFEYLN